MARRRIALITTLVLLAVTAACGKDGGDVATSHPSTQRVTATAAPTTQPEVRRTQDPTAVYPLTGKPAPRAAARRPAVVVKIDNDPNARPQTGLGQADIVFEVEVEGITRFVSVFQSADVNMVGPIRSARSTDVDLVAGLNRPMFAWSGANPTVTGEVNAARDAGLLTSLGHDVVPEEYWRDNSRYAPYNLYSSTSGLRKHTPDGAGPPAPVFEYRRTEGERLPEGNKGVTGVAVNYVGDGRISNVEFVWDAHRSGWARFQTDYLHPNGVSLRHVDSSGRQIAPANVVILETDYGVSAASNISPQAMSVGGGRAIVLTGNSRAVEGHWERRSHTEPFELTTPDGDAIHLTPGRTWVLLPRVGHVRYLSPTRGRALLATH
jgi:hypothetical protein